MNALIDHWPLALVAAAVVLVLLFLLLRPRQRVALTDSAPVRPHMAAAKDAATRGIPAKGIAATAAGVAGSILAARDHEALGPASGPPDDLVQLKGIGPKLAALLNTHGITRFDQIAKLSPAQVDGLDQELGAFRGRLARDHVVDQADYLARGDIDGFEQRFGKL